jgi:transcription antitermination factor NusG
MEAVVRNTDASCFSPDRADSEKHRLAACQNGSGVDVENDVVAETTWHAVWTRSRHESLVCSDLAAKGIDTFLPTFTQISRWSDRKKRIAWPLFPGYCFARFEPDHLSKVVRSTGVVAVLSNGGRPVPIPGFEIEALQRIVASGLPYDPCSQLIPGSRVRVVSGPLSGVVGRLVRKGVEDQLILAVDLLNSGARIQVSAWDIQPL